VENRKINPCNLLYLYYIIFQLKQNGNDRIIKN